MDSTRRTILKSLTWQLAGIVVMTVIGYVFTGSVTAGSGIAVTGAATGFVSYFVHEKLWARVGWGREAG